MLFWSDVESLESGLSLVSTELPRSDWSAQNCRALIGPHRIAAFSLDGLRRILWTETGEFNLIGSEYNAYGNDRRVEITFASIYNLVIFSYQIYS